MQVKIENGNGKAKIYVEAPFLISWPWSSFLHLRPWVVGSVGHFDIDSTIFGVGWNDFEFVAKKCVMTHRADSSRPKLKKELQGHDITYESSTKILVFPFPFSILICLPPTMLIKELIFTVLNFYFKINQMVFRLLEFWKNLSWKCDVINGSRKTRSQKLDLRLFATTLLVWVISLSHKSEPLVWVIILSH